MKPQPRGSAALRAALIVNALLLAQSVSAGGLDKATQEATSFKTWLYGFLGIGAVIYLLYMGGSAWLDRKSWSDFGIACIGVCVVGSVLVLAPYLWTLFSGG